MNWNTKGSRKKECNSHKAWKAIQRTLALCQNPSQTLTNMAKGW